MQVSAVHAAVVLLCGSALVSSASAQTQRPASDAGRAAQQLQQQLQQSNIERASLQADKQRLESELQQLKSEAVKASAERGLLQQRALLADASARDLRASGEAATAALGQLRTQRDELLARFRETVAALQTVEADRNKSQAALAARERELGRCVESNDQLYQLNDQVLTRLEGRGFFRSLGAREPFTRIARTRLENLIDESRSLAAELEFKSAVESAPAL